MRVKQERAYILSPRIILFNRRPRYAYTMTLGSLSSRHSVDAEAYCFILFSIFLPFPLAMSFSSDFKLSALSLFYQNSQNIHYPGAAKLVMRNLIHFRRRKAQDQVLVRHRAG